MSSARHVVRYDSSRRACLTGSASAALLHSLGLSASLGTGLLAPGMAQASATPNSAASATAGSANRAGRRWQNWSGLQSAQARQWFNPADEDELRRWLARSQGTVRPVGAGHSFSPLVPTEANMVSLDRLSGVIRIDRERQTVTAWAGTRLQALARALDAEGLALRNQPDVDVQTLAGAIATGTHGTGATLPALHDDVVGVRLITPQGEVMDWQAGRDDEALAAARVSLGSLGLMTQITFRVVPAFYLHRTVWLEPLEVMLERAGELAARHRHFEFYVLPFTGYAAGISNDLSPGTGLQLPQPADEDVLGDLKALRDWLGRTPRLRRWVARQAIDPDMREEARHRSFRLLSSVRATRFNETEWHVPRERGIPCLRQVVQRLEQRNEVYFPLEFRYVRQDSAWLSPFHGRDSCSIALHAAADEPWRYLLDDFSPLLRAHQGRPHWGKLHGLAAADLARLYPRWADFQRLRRQLDPQGRMLNPHLHTVFGVA